MSLDQLTAIAQFLIIGGLAGICGILIGYTLTHRKL